MKTLNSFEDDDNRPMLTPVVWPADHILLDWLWTKPAPQIARELGCHPSAVRARAKVRNLPRPGPGYWQRKKAGCQLEIPEEVKALITCPAIVGNPRPGGCRRRSPIRRRWRRVQWPSDAEFLQQLWSLPATHFAKVLGCCYQGVLLRAKRLGFPTPGEGYWQRKTAGFEMPIPDAVKKLIEELKRRRG
jgi:hypothetical protein